jgi:hypothetical protein
MHLLRIALVINICALAMSASSGYSQQNLPPPGGYKPIPNFVGTDAGLDFRNTINDRFSGVQPIAPRVGSVPFVSLGPEQDGALLYCTDCQATLPCIPGGTGAWASGTKGQWQCSAPAVALKLDGTDVLGPFNGTRTNEKNILDFGAIASIARINCTTTSGQANVTCSGIASSDFAVNQYVALYGAGPAPSVSQPAGFTLQPTTTTNNPGSATRFTRFAQGCTLQNALAWCTAGSSICQVSNVAFYEQGQTVTIAGAGVGGAALTSTITTLDDFGNDIALATPASTTVSGAAVTGANCTTSRRYQAYPIDARGGWGAPTGVTTVNNTASALNWGNWVDVQVNVPQPPNAPNPTYPLPSNIPIAWAFYCAEGSAPLHLCGVEVPTYSFLFNSSDPAPWNDQLIGGFEKGFPTVVTFHAVGRPYGNDVIEGTAPPPGPVNQILFARILSITGTTVQLSVAPAQSGTFTMSHDNGPNINNAIKASCDVNNRCGTVYTPFEPTLFPVATPIVALRGLGLNLLGGAEPNSAEPNTSAPSGWLWVGALGGTMLQLNQESKPQVDSISLQSSAVNFSGSTMGVAIDMDGFDPGDGLGSAVGCGRQAFRDIYTGQASVGIRLANINTQNCEFGVLESSTINWVYGSAFVSASNIGFLINSVNALATRIDGSVLTGNIGLWSNQSGFYAVGASFGQSDGISIFLGAGIGHPVSIETSRTEHVSRGIYSPVTGGAVGTQIALRGNTWTDIRLPADGAFITLAGGNATILDGNEFVVSELAVNNDFTTDQFSGGIIRAGALGSIEARGNYWSTICGDPYSFVAAVNASGDVCTLSDGSAHHIAPYSRGLGGFRLGTPTGGPMGDGSLNLGGLLFHNGQPLVNWGEASIASIAASGTSFATVNWNTPFGDGNYDFSCVVVDGAGFLSILGSNAKSATAVSFQVKNGDTGAAHSGTANCIAVHH